MMLLMSWEAFDMMILFFHILYNMILLYTYSPRYTIVPFGDDNINSSGMGCHTS